MIVFYYRNLHTKQMKKLLRVLGHQKWLRFGLRDRIIRFFHNPDTAATEKFKIPFFGQLYSGDFSTFLDWSAYYYGAYSKEELVVMREAVEDEFEPVILDVGANIGHHSLFASTIAKEVHSFEPYPKIHDKIKEKIEINNITNIIVHEFGLGSRNEISHFYEPLGCNTGMGSFISTDLNTNHLELPIKKGDEVINANNISKISFIKIDVEGFENEVLKGLQQTLINSRPIVFFEWSVSKKQMKDKDFVDLFPTDYKFYLFTSDKPVLLFFNKSHYSLEEIQSIKVDCNLLAIPNEKCEIFNHRII